MEEQRERRWVTYAAGIFLMVSSLTGYLLTDRLSYAQAVELCGIGLAVIGFRRVIAKITDK